MKAVSVLTSLLAGLNEGSQEAYGRLLPLAYTQQLELANRQLMYQPAGHTYSKTDLVHETYLKLVNQQLKPELNNRAHFFGIASRCMRSLLIDYARKKMAVKRGRTQSMRIDAAAGQWSFLMQALGVQTLLNRHATGQNKSPSNGN